MKLPQKPPASESRISTSYMSRTELLILHHFFATMACWSAENATKAYLRTLTMGKGDKEPDVAEFISAVAAGNNAQLMVMAPSASAATDRPMLLSLVAAAHQSGGRVISVSRNQQELETRKHSLASYSQYVEFLIGEASTLLLTDLKDVDFVLIDCKSSGYESVYRSARVGLKAVTVVGYNALEVGRNSNSSPWFSNGFRTHFLPIGGGLMVSRSSEQGRKSQKKSCWVVRVDELTGEEHAYRIVSPRANRQTMIRT